MKRTYIPALLAASFLLCINIGCSHEGHSHDDHGHDDHDEMVVHDGHDADGEHHDHEEAGKTATTFHLENDDIKRLQIEVSEVVPSRFTPAIKTYGEILPAATDVTQITAPTAGTIRFTADINRGANVSAGSVIARIDQSGTSGATAERAAQSNVESTKREYERLKRLHEERLATTAELNVARAAYEAAVAAHSPAALSGQVKASGGGVVTEMYVSNGQYVEPGQAIATVARSGKMSLRVDIPERYASSTDKIQGLNIRLAGSDEVVSITPSSSTKTVVADSRGYIPLLFSFENPGITRTGVYADVYLLCGESGDVISVPREAVIEDQGNFFVYVAADVHDDGIQFERRPVQIGAFDGLRYSIVSGLQSGETVATSGASMLRMAQAQSTPAEGHHHH